MLVTFLLGRRLYSAREGPRAALLMAVLWAPIFYSQEPRTDFLILAAALSGFSVSPLRKGWREARKFCPGSPQGLCCLLSCLLRALYRSILDPAPGPVDGVRVRRQDRACCTDLLALYGLILLAYLPWVAVLFGTVNECERHSRIYTRAGMSDVPGHLKFLFNGASEERAAIWLPNNVEPLVLLSF